MYSYKTRPGRAQAKQDLNFFYAAYLVVLSAAIFLLITTIYSLLEANRTGEFVLQNILFTAILGTAMVVAMTLIMYFGQKGKINAVFTAFQEVADESDKLKIELKKANQWLLRSNKELKDISQALEEATIMIKTDLQGRVTFVNQYFCDVSKYSYDEWIGQKLDMFNALDTETDFYTEIPLILKQKQVWNGEVQKITKDGVEFWLQVTFMPIISKEGELYQYLAICTDITGRKNAEKELTTLKQERFNLELKEQQVRSMAIINGQEKERKRMAMEIHDGIGQMLTALKFGIQSIDPKNDHEEDKLTSIRKLIFDTIKETRRISADLLPSVLSDFGIEAGLNELLKTTRSSTKAEITFHNQLDIKKRLNKPVEVSLYRIIQESLNNAIKYSEATSIKVSLFNDNEYLSLSIIDNGKGFDMSKAMVKKGGTYTGNGLNSMVERSNLINGKMLLNSSPGKGTNILVEIPLNTDIFNSDEM